MIKEFFNQILFRYIHKQWNIAIADMTEDMSLANIQWLKHNYKDRWFADPFFVGESNDSYVVLVEEFMRDQRKGRLAQLTISKEECKLLKNETILDLKTHLSFPNPIFDNKKIYVLPESGALGKTMLYEYEGKLSKPQLFSNLPLADAVIYNFERKYYLLYTIGDGCNGNILHVSASEMLFNNYKSKQEIVFEENIARRAGNVFIWNGKVISPAQVCNKDYGEAVSLQELSIDNGIVNIVEIKRIPPPTKDYPNGFHTFNVKNKKVVIDGYKYKSPMLHSIYLYLRSLY